MRRDKDIFDLFDEFDRFFDVFDRRLPMRTTNYEYDVANYRMPLTDLWEIDDEVITTIELPGVDKQDIDLKIENNRITVKVEKKTENKEKKKGAYRFERSYQGFYRKIELPVDVDSDKAKATYKNGILEIRIPKLKKETKVNRLSIE